MEPPLWSGIPARILGALLDPTIVFSFDHTGYLLHSQSFRAGDLQVDMRGKVCLITGADAGLGFATARKLTQHGARVLLLCRDEERGRAAVDEIRRESDDGQAYLEQVELSDLGSVRDFAARLADDHVDVLIHNAAVLPTQWQETRDGIETALAKNVVGPFLLTSLLIPKLRAARAARVISVSSAGMYTQRLVVADMEGPDEVFDGVAHYARTKRAQVVLNEMWAERMSGTPVTFNCMHPGWADTPIVRSSLPLFHRLMRPILRSAEEGIDTIVWLVMCERIAKESGHFWFDREVRWTHFFPWTQEDPEEREQLWNLCRRLSGLGPDTAARRARRAGKRQTRQPPA